MNGILSLLGLARKAGRVEIGEEPVGSAARAKHARLILVAGDSAASSVRRAYSFSQTGACLCLTIDATKEDMGRALGRTSCAMCAVTDIGLAEAIAKKLSGMDEGRYGAAYAQLQVKAKRAAQRRAEAEQHEKNLQQGKKRAKRAEPPKAEEKPAPRAKAPAKRPGGGRDTGARKSGAKKSEAPRRRFEGSLPVKKGKGSKKKSV